MTTPRTLAAVSRRTALAGLGAGGLGLALAASAWPAAAQDTTSEAMASHPIVGVWNVNAPAGPDIAVFAADGTNTHALPTASAGPQGVRFASALVGTWEPIGPRTVHFTAVQQISDANGAFVGTVTIDGHPTVSEDGQTLRDDAPETTVTIRDAAGIVVDVITGGPPATGVRMAVGAPGFPEGTPTAATPGA